MKPSDGPDAGPQTWHYGVVARWWAEFDTEGPEIEYFRRFVEAGQPALDVACGTGRLLIPYLNDGLDVDGCDISSDMLALCRERAEREGLSPNLFAQAMHELDLPRTYRTIFVCGGFGLGGSRADDEEALRRIYAHLEPGGTLVLDNEVPYHDGGWGWARWTTKGEDLPEPWPESGTPRTAADGSVYELRSRIVDVDPLAQSVTLEMRGSITSDGQLVEEDEHVLKMTLYFTNELRLMIERAGFTDVDIFGDYTDEAPTRDSAFVVFVARKPG